MKKVIIVGAGIGGLASGIRLQKAGFQVDIYEKNAFAGGKIHQLSSGGYSFSLGPDTIASLASFQALFDLVQAPLSHVAKVTQPDFLFESYFSANPREPFTPSSQLPQLVATTEKTFPEQTRELLAYIGQGQKNLAMTQKFFTSSSFSNWRQFFNFRSLSYAINAGRFSQSRKYIKKFITNDKLVDGLSFYSLFEGPSAAFKGPSWMSLKPLMDFLWGSYHVEKGLPALIKQLETLFSSLGGTLHYSTPVDKILIENQKAYGVQVGNQLALSDYVLCNSDFSYVIKHLIKAPQAKKGYIDEKIDAMAYSPSALIIGLGLKRPYPLYHHNRYYMSHKYHQNRQELYSGELLTDPSFLIQPSIATSLEQNNSLTLMVPVSHLGVSAYGWEEETLLYYKKKVLTSLTRLKGFETLKEDIDHTFYFTPLDFQSTFNAHYGACFGLLPTYRQSYIRRPQTTLPGCDGLYFVGASIHPGAGIPFVLQGAENVTDEIFQHSKISL